MPVRNPASDRTIKFVPNRILKAEELQNVMQLQVAKDKFGVGSMFRDGGTLNVKVTVTGDTVKLDPMDAALPMYVFLNGRFETISPATFGFSGITEPSIFLNYTIWRVTYNDAGTIQDSSLIDSATGEKVAEIGQLEFTIEATDKSTDTTGVQLNTTTQFDKNQHTIALYQFYRDSGGALQLVDDFLRATDGRTYDRAQEGALGSKAQSGMVRVTWDPPGLALSPFDPNYLALDTRLKALEAIHPHKDWAPMINQILDRVGTLEAAPPPPPPPAPKPFLQIAPSSLDFTNTPYVAGQSVQKAFTVTNYGEGDADYDLTNLAAAYGFTVLGPIKAIIPGYSAQTFVVVFAPAAPMPTPAGGPVQVNNLVCTVTGSTRTAASDPAFQFSLASIEFGNVANGNFKIASVTVTNVGASTGTYNIELPAGMFAIADDGTNPASRSLAPGGSALIQVRYAPTELQQHSAAMHFTQFSKNTCALRGTGIAVAAGPQFQFVPTNLNFLAKLNNAALAQMTITNIGDQSAVLDLVLANIVDFAVPGFTPVTLNPGSSTVVTVSATATASGDKSGVLSARNYGINQVTLQATVAASGPKFVFAQTTAAFTGVQTNAGQQVITFNVTNNGDTAGTPDIRVSQSQSWFRASYTPASLGVGQSLSLQVQFTPTADMTTTGYPSIAGMLFFASYGGNSCSASATVTGPVFIITPATQDGGTVEFGVTKDLVYTVKNTGTVNGTVALSTDPLWSIVGSASIALNAGASAQFTLRFVNNDAAFTAKYSTPQPTQLYEFTAKVYGASNVATAAVQARSKDTRAPRFSPRPNGGTGLLTVQCPDIPIGPGGSSIAHFIVYNIGNISGTPTFTLVSGDSGYFTITRDGVDSDIAPGGSGNYIITAHGAEIAQVVRSMTDNLDEGGFQFNVTFTANVFATRFEDAAGNPITTFDFGAMARSSSYSSETRTVYLRSIGTVQRDAQVSVLDRPYLTAAGVGSLVNTTRVAVNLTSSGSVYGPFSATVTATAAISPLKVTGTWNDPPASEPIVFEQLPAVPIYGYVTTPYGRFLTSDPSLAGQYVANPVIDWTGGNVVSGGK